MNGRDPLRSCFATPRAAQRRNSVPDPIGNAAQLDRMGLTGPRCTRMERVRVGQTAVVALVSPTVS